MTNMKEKLEKKYTNVVIITWGSGEKGGEKEETNAKKPHALRQTEQLGGKERGKEGRELVSGLV